MKKKGKLLVINSDSFERDMMNRVFCSHFEVRLEENVWALSSVLRCFCPDVVLLESCSGALGQLTAACDALYDVDPHIPLLVSVNDNSKLLERNIRQKRVFYYMVRPYNLRELWDAVECAYEFSQGLRR